MQLTQIKGQDQLTQIKGQDQLTQKLVAKINHLNLTTVEEEVGVGVTGEEELRMACRPRQQGGDLG
jgi:hypothetical protein